MCVKMNATLLLKKFFLSKFFENVVHGAMAGLIASLMFWQINRYAEKTDYLNSIKIEETILRRATVDLSSQVAEYINMEPQPSNIPIFASFSDIDIETFSVQVQRAYLMGPSFTELATTSRISLVAVKQTIADLAERNNQFRLGQPSVRLAPIEGKAHLFGVEGVMMFPAAGVGQGKGLNSFYETPKLIKTTLSEQLRVAVTNLDKLDEELKEDIHQRLF